MIRLVVLLMMELLVENSDYPYHELDPTTPWYEWLMYCEICHQLNVPNQPSGKGMPHTEII